jgi:hypothetical protein
LERKGGHLGVLRNDREITWASSLDLGDGPIVPFAEVIIKNNGHLFKEPSSPSS